VFCMGLLSQEGSRLLSTLTADNRRLAWWAYHGSPLLGPLAARTLWSLLRRSTTEDHHPAFAFAVGRLVKDLSLDCVLTLELHWCTGLGSWSRECGGLVRVDPAHYNTAEEVNTFLGA
jgi:selenocysteine lyase/cysteine desulfurase